MFLDNDKTFLNFHHYGLRNGTLVKSTVLRWTEAIQAKRINIIYGQDLFVPGLSFVLKGRFFWKHLKASSWTNYINEKCITSHNSRFCMLYTIIFIDYKLKRAFNVTRILGGLFYIFDHQNPSDVLAALAVFQNHLQSCLYKITDTFCPPWQELENSLHSPQSKFSAPV